MNLGIPLSGIQAGLHRAAVTANNVANVFTPGFRASRAEQGTVQPGGVRVVGTPVQVEQGPLANTGDALTAAATGDGFFVLEDAGGAQSFTRAGTFSLNAEGLLVTSGGERVAPGVTVPPGTVGLAIGPDGIVSGTPPGEVAPVAFGRIELARFANPAGLQAVGGNRYVATAASGAPQPIAADPSAGGQIRQGFLEGSNVELARELPEQLSATRAVQVNAAVLRAQDDTLGTLLDLIQ